jgi:hypothetical protein
MKIFPFGLLVGSVAVSTLFALQQAAKSRETIWLGTDLTLGMAEDAVIKKLAEFWRAIFPCSTRNAAKCSLLTSTRPVLVVPQCG